MVTRRAFLATWTGGLLATPLAAEGQQAGRIARVGDLVPSTGDSALTRAFLDGLGDAGYVEGQNVSVERLYARGQPDQLLGLARELVHAPVDVIFVRGPGALLAAKKATSTIPIVAVDLESDPVAAGFVRILARPGGNVTGIFLDLPELSGKQLEFLREIIPRVSRVAVIGDAVLNAAQFHATDTAAKALAIQVQELHVRVPADLEPALEKARRGHAGAVILLSSPLIFVHRTDIGSMAAARRLPAVSTVAEFAEAGGLMVYGPSLREAFRRCGGYVAKILRGAKPGDLPIERPEKFDLVINSKTATALGLTIPPSLLARADQVIE